MALSQRMTSKSGIQAVVSVLSIVYSATYFLACTFLLVLVVADHFSTIPRTLVQNKSSTNIVASPEYADHLVAHYIGRFNNFKDTPDDSPAPDRVLASLDSTFQDYDSACVGILLSGNTGNHSSNFSGENPRSHSVSCALDGGANLHAMR